MIYFNQTEASKYMGVSVPTFRKYKSLVHDNQYLVPKSSKSRVFHVEGRTPSRKEAIWSKATIDSSIIRVKKWQKSQEKKRVSKSKRTLDDATEKSKKAHQDKQQKSERDARIKAIFNEFMGIRRKTGQV